jgi:hypothetical protein
VTLDDEQVRGEELVCTCNNSCTLEGLGLTVHIANFKNAAPVLSAMDVEAISKFGSRNKIDYISMSFVRNSADVAACRMLLDRCVSWACLNLVGWERPQWPMFLRQSMKSLRTALVAVHNWHVGGGRLSSSLSQHDMDQSTNCTVS